MAGHHPVEAADHRCRIPVAGAVDHPHRREPHGGGHARLRPGDPTRHTSSMATAVLGATPIAHDRDPAQQPTAELLLPGADSAVHHVGVHARAVRRRDDATIEWGQSLVDAIEPPEPGGARAPLHHGGGRDPLHARHLPHRAVAADSPHSARIEDRGEAGEDVPVHPHDSRATATLDGHDAGVRRVAGHPHHVSRGRNGGHRLNGGKGQRDRGGKSDYQ